VIATNAEIHIAFQRMLRSVGIKRELHGRPTFEPVIQRVKTATLRERNRPASRRGSAQDA
jgi:hypothetical protein